MRVNLKCSHLTSLCILENQCGVYDEIRLYKKTTNDQNKTGKHGQLRRVLYRNETYK